ncbi:glycosyltransferase [Candidatus Nomurabacteria bacterium]|nr:glycosyltransferase [Candidatus Nomurabacteria bacterium]
MRILLLITKAEIGGAQTMTLTLAKGLQAMGHEVVVGFGKNTGNFLPEVCAKNRIAAHAFEHLERSLNPLSLRSFTQEFKNFLAKESFDVVHLNSSNTLPAAKVIKQHFPKIKTVFTFRGLSYLDPGSKKPLLRILFKIFFGHYLPYVDAPVFVSKTNRDYAHSIGLSKSQHVIYNAPEVTFLKKLQSRETFAMWTKKDKAFFERAKILGSIGRLAYPKNYEFILDNFQKLLIKNPGLIFVMIGSGPEKVKYQKIIAAHKLEDHVFIIENIDDAAKYIPGFDVFVLPSLYEGLSITLVEALKAGVPILTSNVGGSHEVVNDDLFQLYTSQNFEDFKTKLEAFLDDEHLYSATVQSNLSFSTHFSSQTMVEEYFKVYS